VQKEKPCGPTAAQQVGTLFLRGQVGCRDAPGRISLHAGAFQFLALAYPLQAFLVCFAFGLPLTASVEVHHLIFLFVDCYDDLYSKKPSVGERELIHCFYMSLLIQ